MDHDTSEWQSADASSADTLGDGLSSGESCDFTLGMFSIPEWEMHIRVTIVDTMLQLL